MRERSLWRWTLLMLAATMLVACGGEEADQPDNDEPRIGISLLAGECGDYVGGSNITARLGSLAIQFYDQAGKLVPIKGRNAVSFTKEQLAASVKVTDIPAMTGARVVFSGFTDDNNSVPAWRGEVSGVDFVKGKETKVASVLYPVAGLGCFPSALMVPRFGHTVTELSDGRILIVGGFTYRNNGIWQATDEVELLDPETGSVDKLNDMNEFRAFHHAILLPGDRVLLIGGVRELNVAQKMTVADYPVLPFTESISAVGVEVYTVKMKKVNERITAADLIDQSTAEYIDYSDGSVILPFQGYAYVATDETTGAGTIFAVGGVKDGAAQSKIWGFEIAPSETAVGITVTEYHTGNTETFVAPVVAPAGTDGNGNPQVLVLGGRKATSTVKFAHLVSKDQLTEWTAGDAPNLFFGVAAADGGKIVATGGLELPKDATEFLKHEKGDLFDLNLTALFSGPLYWGTWGHEVVMDATEGYFTVLGGMTGFNTADAELKATNFYEHVDMTTMDFFTHTSFGEMKNPRAFHRVVKTATGRLYMTGGIGDLKQTEDSIVDIIEIYQTAKPF